MKKTIFYDKSYSSLCRFENTLAKLQDCEDHFDSTKDTDEAHAAIDLYRLCVTIAKTYSLPELESRLSKLQAEAEDEDEDEDEDE